jgi:hypothetical protein
MIVSGEESPEAQTAWLIIDALGMYTILSQPKVEKQNGPLEKAYPLKRH